MGREIRKLPACACRAAFLVERIHKSNVLRSDELVLDEDRGRRRFLLQNAQRQRDQFVSVALREVSYRADQARAGPPQFMARFMDRILSDDGAELSGAGLFKRTQ